MSAKKQTFLQGAMILVAANIIVKIIGAVFKIPVFNLLDADGVGLFNNAYNIYTFMFVVATAGFPVAISKMVSESVTRGKTHEADRIFKIALALMLVVGIIGTAILYLFAEPLAFFVNKGSGRAATSIMAISPAVVCTALIAAFRGYFQGKQNMYPTAISEVVEALGKLIIGYALAVYFVNRGGERATEYASAGAIFGVAAGTFLALIVIVLIYVMTGKNTDKSDRAASRPVPVLLKELVWLAVPVMLGAAVSTLTNVIDTVTVVNRLQSITVPTQAFMDKFAIFATEGNVVDGIFANKIYGLYGYAATLFNLPQSLIVTALSMSIVPTISSLRVRGNIKAANDMMGSTVRITMLFAAPCALGMSALSEPILSFVYSGAREQATLAASMLQTLSIAIISVSLVSVTSAILQSLGKVHIPVINMFIGGIIKVVINYTLVAMPPINIDGAPIGTNVCYFVIALLNFHSIAKVTHVKFNLFEFFVKPLFCAGMMGAAVYFSHELIARTGISASIDTLGSICIGAVLYVLFIFLTKTIKQSDVEMMPMGKNLAKLLKRIKLL